MTILETPRLRLRHLVLSDQAALFALYANPAVSRYIPDAPTSLDETRAEIEWHRHGHPQHPQLGLWATELKESGQFIGRCGLLPWEIDGRFEVEIAFLIDPAHWGNGLATEAAQAIAHYARQRLGYGRLICLIDAKNRASIRVAEKIGMSFEREGEDELGPYLLYACTSST